MRGRQTLSGCRSRTSAVRRRASDVRRTPRHESTSPERVVVRPTRDRAQAPRRTNGRGGVWVAAPCITIDVVDTGAGRSKLVGNEGLPPHHVGSQRLRRRVHRERLHRHRRRIHQDLNGKLADEWMSFTASSSPSSWKRNRTRRRSQLVLLVSHRGRSPRASRRDIRS